MVVHTTPSAPKRDDAGFDQVKGAFLASLNHEVRTPLSGIVGMLDLLAETTLDEDQQEYLEAARLCTESLTELLHTSLEYAALEAGQITLDESEFNLRETLEAVLSLYLPKAQSKRLRLTLSMETGLPETILGDGPRIREMIGHLVNNAVKFTLKGLVEVRAAIERLEQGAPHLIFQVRDTGVGIPSDKLDGIFDSFRQGDSGLSRAYPGLGLGLALTHRLVGVMGGKISVESEAGVGSTFTITLPWRQTGESLHPPETTPAEATDDGPIILAVEDNPVGLRVLRHVLHRRHFRVVCATNGREAIAAAKGQQVDLILMDLQMPDINGLEASVEIRKLPGYETVPILALTANYSDQTREQCLAAGMQAFLSKPVDAHELWSTVSRYLNTTASE